MKTILDDSFENIYKENSSMVYKISLKATRNPASAEDISQNVFIALYKNLHKFEGNSKISTWLYRVTINAIIDYLRRESRLIVSSEFDNIPSYATPEDILLRKERRIIAFNNLSCISDKNRPALEMRLEGLGINEISKQLGINMPVTRTKICRGKRQLTAYFKALGSYA